MFPTLDTGSPHLNTIRYLACSITILCLGLNSCPADVHVQPQDNSPQAEFAASELRAAIQRGSVEGDWQIVLQLVPSDQQQNLHREGFCIATQEVDGGRQIQIRAVDPAGLLYGGLEVAEIIRAHGINHVTAETHNPHMPMRGTKFNIPLDVRTPSYTDVCDSAQMNIPEMWSFDFWQEYIDTLARYRYNFVSLWSLHPFPSLVRVPEYPNIALDDVWRSQAKWDEYYSLNGKGFVSDTILQDVEVVKKMTIEEKIAFWRKVMAYGKSRNVDFYIVTWNIFTDGTAGQYGITDDYRNPTTVDYFRKSVAQCFRTYPDLAGVGLTTGENMPNVGFQEKEDWAMATYGQGVMDAAREQPDRKITFIHRQHMAKASEISRTFQPLIDQANVDFIFSFKYAKAHVYSATTQPYHHDFVKDLGNLKTIWTLRNDDVYYFRWGAPRFVREFIKNIPHDVSQGYYFGSDQWIWGREFLDRNTHPPRKLEIDKHWYQWMLWGRFGYDPDLEQSRLVGILADRFSLPVQDAEILLNAWQNASMIYPITTGFHWGSLDFQWYIEGCESNPNYARTETGFHDVNRFITLPPHANSNCLSIPEYVKLRQQPEPSGRRTPFQVADRLDEHAGRAVGPLYQIEPTTKEFERTVTDIRIVAHLGHYFADKIRGATHLAVFRATSDPDSQSQAIHRLVDAARHWYDYAGLALQHHKHPVWLNRVGFVDWRRNYEQVLEDVRIAGGNPAEFGLPVSVDLPAEPIARPYRTSLPEIAEGRVE